jgi:hypothetical protein
MNPTKEKAKEREETTTTKENMFCGWIDWGAKSAR